jgi:hypothetical protein
MDDRDDDEGATAAEQAFEALRAEVAGMRQSLRAILEAMLKIQGPDYSETLGAIAKRLEVVSSFMASIEQHPAIRTAPAQYTQAIAAAGDGLIYKSARELDQAKATVVAERHELAAMIGTMRGKWKQWEWLAWTGIGAFALGLLISPLFARVLPFGWDGQVAAFIMNADRWGAGSALMQAENPEAWRSLMDDFNLVKNNQASLATCYDAAAKAKKDQHCSIVVPVRGPWRRSAIAVPTCTGESHRVIGAIPVGESQSGTRVLRRNSG